MPKSFSTSILLWYEKNRRDLPWRHTRDPYKIWVSEMMLQQTTVQTVIPYYERWCKTFPTIKHLSQAPIENVLKSWQGLGYYARARNLHKASQIVVKEYGGNLPKDAVAVRKLPGFGPYATGSVLSIAYDMPLQIIDANVRRVIMRILMLSGVAGVGQDSQISAYLGKVFPKKRAGDFNQALMELGALICKPKEPLCSQCPVTLFCKAFHNNVQNDIPIKKIKEISNIHAVVAVISKGGKVFLQKRMGKGLLQGMWEFPGGKIEVAEEKIDALARELREELKVELKSAEYLFDVVHSYTQFRARISVYAATLHFPIIMNKNRIWADKDDILRLPLPSGTRKIIDKIFLSPSNALIRGPGFGIP